MARRKQGLYFYEKKKRINAGAAREIALWVLYTVIAVALAFFAVFYFGYRISVIGQSMEPKYSNGQEVLINRLSFHLSGVNRGDVIAFYPGGNTDAHPYVKRVVGVPGDVLQILEGELYVNGVPEENASDYDMMEDPGNLTEPVTLGNGEYYVLGDNRNNSEDSRSASIGTVTEAMMIGKVWLALPEG